MQRTKTFFLRGCRSVAVVKTSRRQGNTRPVEDIQIKRNKNGKHKTTHTILCTIAALPCSSVLLLLFFLNKIYFCCVCVTTSKRKRFSARQLRSKALNELTQLSPSVRENIATVLVGAPGGAVSHPPFPNGR